MITRRQFVRAVLMLCAIQKFLQWFIGQSSPFDVFEGLMILAFFAYEIWFAEPVREAWRRRKLRDTFDLRLIGVGSLPGGDTTQGSVALQLRVMHSTEIRKFNLRF